MGVEQGRWGLPKEVGALVSRRENPKEKGGADAGRIGSGNGLTVTHGPRGGALTTSKKSRNSLRGPEKSYGKGSAGRKFTSVGTRQTKLDRWWGAERGLLKKHKKTCARIPCGKGSRLPDSRGG